MEDRKQKLYLSGIFLIIFLFITMYFFQDAKKSPIFYNKVKVIVTDVEIIYPKNYKEFYKYIIKVSENGKVKELGNVKVGYSYYKGKMIEVFKDENGRLYEDEDGIRSNTKFARVYFISLGVTFIVLCFFVYNIIAYRRNCWYIFNFIALFLYKC